MTTPCVTPYPVLKSVTLTTLGFYCKASGKAVIISLRVFRKHLHLMVEIRDAEIHGGNK